jgi:hypothetical protein
LALRWGIKLHNIHIYDHKNQSEFRRGSDRSGEAEEADTIELKLRKDSHADIWQWFHFRLQGARHQETVMRILNAGEATYAKGWENYRAVASYDRETWFRVDGI